MSLRLFHNGIITQMAIPWTFVTGDRILWYFYLAIMGTYDVSHMIMEQSAVHASDFNIKSFYHKKSFVQK